MTRETPNCRASATLLGVSPQDEHISVDRCLISRTLCQFNFPIRPFWTLVIVTQLYLNVFRIHRDLQSGCRFSAQILINVARDSQRFRPALPLALALAKTAL
jgi:hypothetical protein